MSADGPRGTDDGKGTPAARPFDPRPHLRRIRSRGQEADYLDVRWRLAWLRAEHPDARITTEHVTLTDSQAVFRATVEIPSGGCATGYGSEEKTDWADYIEKAETKAIGRALAALGYGTQFALDFDLEEQAPSGDVQPLADTPVERPVVSVEAESPAPPTRPVAQLEAVEERERARTTPEPPPPEPRAAARVTDLREARRASRPAPAAEPGEYDPANYSWNEFWFWARGLGYRGKQQLEQLLGVDDLLARTPAEARALVEAYRREHGEEA